MHGVFLRQFKSRWFATCFLFFLSTLPVVVAAQEKPDDVEHIQSFDVELSVNADSTVSVRERIAYHFITPRHGIFRDIPVKYTDQYGRNKNLVIDDISVTDTQGRGYPYTQTEEGKNIQIKIGDPDVLIRGDHIYIIAYRVHYAIGYFNDFDELYWNVTGNNWPVPIQSASVEMVTPAPLQWSLWRLACYVGPLGGTASCGGKSDSVFNYQDDEMVQKVTLAHAGTLAPGEGITVAFGFPKGLVSQPKWRERTVFFLRDNPIVFLPVLVFCIMFALWYRRGRDPKGRGVIIAEYDLPENLSILEVAGFMNEEVTAKHVSGAIVDLAIKGYIRIEKEAGREPNKKYVFHRLSKAASKDSFEELLLKAIFKDLASSGQSVKLAQLHRRNLAKQVFQIEKAVLKRLVEKSLFTRVPKAARKYAPAIIVLVAVVFAIYADFGLTRALSFTISMTIIGFFLAFMPQKTPAGAIMKERILGLKEYLQIAEKNRIEFHNAPEKSPELFEKLLPAAMVLGVTAIWAKEFEDIYTRPPEWYSGPAGTHFSAAALGSDLNSFSSAAASALASTPGGSSGSGGGGSSGGGGGGGGGGSW